jgi:hypothetical protein
MPGAPGAVFFQSSNWLRRDGRSQPPRMHLQGQPAEASDDMSPASPVDVPERLPLRHRAAFKIAA